MRAGETTPPSLFSRLRTGRDTGAWRELDDRYRELILRYARGRGLQPADAEDVRQQVMLQLTECIDRFSYEPALGRFRNYLGAMVRHAISRQQRARHRKAERQVLDVTALDEIAADVDADWENEWRQHHYRLAMARIRETTTAASLDIFRDLLAGDAVEAVAERHRTTAANVYKIKQRVRERLRVRIQEQLRDERP